MKKLGFGCMRLPLNNKEDDADVNIEKVKEMVDEYLEKGFIYFDTAYMYHKGQSERVMKKALVERYDRDKFILADKMPVGMLKCKEDTERIFLDQKEKCGVEYFDYYLLHCLNRENFDRAEKYGVFEYLSDKKAKGEIKTLGFSFHDNAVMLEEILTKHPEMEFVQLQINYLDWESDKVQSRLCYETARRHSTPIIVMEPVRGGALARVPNMVKEMFRERDESMSPASWAVRYTAGLEGVFMVLSGMSDINQLRDNMGYMADFVALNEEEREMCLKAGKIISNADTVACTACRYCAEECPMAIAIPEIFTAYNRKVNGDEGGKEAYERAVAEVSPQDCTQCRACVRMCPQKLDIPLLLKKCREAME